MYVKVNFEHAQGKGTANALVDSGATENFIDIRTAERWGLPQKTLSNPRPIVNVDGTENKAGAVTKVCILDVQYQKGQQLQRFYITDLGFDWVLLGYPWLHEFNPHINWKEGEVQEEVTFKTMTNAWERWRELRRTALVAQVQVDLVTVDETVIRRDMYVLQKSELTMIEERCDAKWGAVVSRTNFAQDWAREANEAKQVLALTAKVPNEYCQHELVFSEEAAKCFPPSRPEDHAIRLKPGAPAEINCKIYPLTKTELEATRKFLDDNLALGFIEECDEGGSPWSTPWFFTGKKDGGLRPLQDYRVVNSWTIHDVYPIPRIEQILEELEGKVLFTALDIRWGYHNIRICEEDQWKAAFKTPHGLFKPKVMFFRLSNSPPTFQRFMDRIFAPLKRKYPGLIFCYMDDILIATGEDLELHRRIVHNVLDLLKQESLFCKISKCQFEQRSITYLGIIVEAGTIRINPTKINGLLSWPRKLTTVKQLCSTLRVYGYHRTFIPGYANIVRPLNNLLKQDTPFEWKDEHTQAMDKLAQAVAANPVLQRSDYE